METLAKRLGRWMPAVLLTALLGWGCASVEDPEAEIGDVQSIYDRVPSQEEAAPVPVPVPEPSAETPEVTTWSSSEDAAAYTLKVGDGVVIALRGIPNPDQIECLVDEWGTISLPLINEVEATGLSASELAKKIRQTYIDNKIYKNISVNVLIPTRYYFMQGEIRHPGRYQLVSAVRLSQAIASAAGFTEFANGKVVIRRDGVVYKEVGNAKKLDQNPQDDILLEPGDIIEAKRGWL